MRISTTARSKRSVTRFSRPTFVPVSASTDDGLLGEIELAMQLRGAAELRALDEITPLADPR